MRTRVALAACAVGLVIGNCAIRADTQESRPALARPTAEQLAWHDCELGMFIHFAPNTWTDQEYDDLSLPLDKFNPDKLDTDQWVAAAEAIGAQYIVFVAKHAGGFCLWQTETTDYSVKSTPWRHGRGDVLVDLATSCRKRGMRLGVYVSPADRKHGAEVGGKCATPEAQEAYNKLYRAQLTEVLTTIKRVHGDPPAGGVFEVWFDGSIVVPVGDILAQFAPHAMIFQGPHATIRWVGNEDGVAPYPAWNAVSETVAKTGEATAQHGDPQGTVWLPNECDARSRDTWFWNTKNAATLKSVDALMDMYCCSVGHGAVLLLNQTPDTTGLIPEADVQRGAEFAAEVRRRFGHSLAETSGRGELIELVLKKPATIRDCVIMEDIAQGERVREYVVEGLVDGQWKELTHGTAIGHKKIDRIAPVTTDQVRLRVLRAADEPLIRRLAVYGDPKEPHAALFDELTPLFADSSPTDGATRMEYDVPRGVPAGVHVLITGLPPQAAVRWGLHSANEARAYRLIAVPVEQNTGLGSRTEAWDGKVNPHVIRRAPFRVFEALEPAGDTVQSDPNGVLALRIEVPVAADAKPGAQSYTLELTAGDWRQMLEWVVQVYAVTVPPAGSQTRGFTNWFSPDIIAERHHLERWSEPFWDMLGLYADLMARGRQNTFWVRWGDFARVADGQVIVDRPRLERYIRLFLSRGFTRIEGGHVAGRHADNWDSPRLDFVLTGADWTEAPGRTQLAALLSEVRAALGELQLPPQVEYVQHLADEPTDTNADNYRALAEFAREQLPGIKIFDATMSRKLAGVVDLWCPQVQEYQQNRDFFEARRQAGDQVWVYTCCAPGGPWLNRLLDQERLRPLYLGWALAKYDLAGFLHWGLNHYGGQTNPFETSVVPHTGGPPNFLPAGDTHVIYPGATGPLSGQRFEAQRIGLEDAELLRMLKQREAAAAERIITSVFRAFDDYDKEVNAYRAARRLLLVALAADPQPTSQESRLDAYNVIWTSPSADASGSMPIGNGVVGLNVWVETGGDLLFYIARVDAWSECERLLKLGRVRVSLAPNPFAAGQPFRQELILREGRIALTAGSGQNKVELSLVVDAHAPVVQLNIRSASPIKLTSSLETWRTERRVLTDKVELQSSWTMRDAPDDVVQRQAWESADVVADDPTAVVWYHRNEHSIVPFTLKHQGLEEIADRFADPLIHRTFGGRMESPQLHKVGPTSLAADDVTDATIRIVTHSAQTPTVDAWLNAVQQMAAAAVENGDARPATARWWGDFWDRSWIFVQGDPAEAVGAGDLAPPSRATQAYILQRWMIAGASRGSFPPKFNGSIFTVDPKFTEGQPFNADWRKWGGCYWWQNTRLPYYPMLAAGDFDLMQPLFRFYEAAVPGCQTRAQLYYHADGVYFPETMTTFATYANSDYGWDRAGVDRSVVQSPWWQWAWQQSLELTQLMLDYAVYTGDERFLTERALPLACEALRYYDSRFGRDEHGKLIISPTQAVETYWDDVINDAPSVAGLHAVCAALLALPQDVGTPEDRALWRRMKDATPPLPTRRLDDQLVMAPAQKYKDKRSNVETPELYGLFPFRVLGLDKPNFEAALEAYRRRPNQSHVGWTQDGAFAALLGLTDEAQTDLLAKARNSHPNFRFPAMWGPNFDWLPDQDHGSNLMTLLQLMLLQCDGDRMRLLPAWPKEWDVSFKLHAPRGTTVECEYRQGRIVSLKVTPAARRADVTVGSS